MTRKINLLFLLCFSIGLNLIGSEPSAAHIKSFKTNGFELNKGQWPEQVVYKTDLTGATRLFLEKDRLTYVLTNEIELAAHHESEHESFKTKAKVNDVLHSHAFQMVFVNSNTNVEVEGNERLPYYHNYFIGSDQSKWASEVPVFSSLLYRNIYNNIDVKVNFNNKLLKYDYILKPGAKASDIKFKFNGAERIYISKNSLHIETSVGQVVENAPYSYQFINGKKVEVPCEYFYNETTGEVSFVFPKGYNSNYELIIDPVVVASTHSGSTSTVYGHTATHDKAGNIYTGGRCFGQNYPVTIGAFQTTFGGNVDESISKLNPNGSSLIWATFIGGSNTDYAHSMYVNDNFELFVYGTTSSSNYPVTPGCFDNSFNGIVDIIVSKLNSTGTALLGSTYVGGSAQEGNSNVGNNYGDSFRGEIIVNDNGEPYVCSNSLSNNFPVTPGAYDASYNGGQDAVIFKMNPNLTTMIFSTYLGGSLDDSGFGIRLNTCGEIYVTGGTGGGGFPTTPGALNTNFIGGPFDGYIAHFNTNGNSLINSSFYGTSAHDVIYFLDIDVNNDVYVFGNTTGSIPVSPGAYGNPGSGNFVAKLQPSLNNQVFSTVIGNGAGNFAPSALMVDIFLNIYLCGWGSVNGYPVTPNAFQLTPNGADFYLVSLAPNAASLNYGTFFGSAASEHVDGGTSRFNQQGMVYQAVCECGFSLPTVPWAYAPINGAGCDIGVFKIDFQNGLVLPVTSTMVCAGNTVSIAANIPTGVANPSFSYQPGGTVSNSPVFTVSPGTTTTYTLFGYGLNCNNTMVTQTNVVTVSVNPNPVLSPMLSNVSCTSATNFVNLGIGFNPGGAPNYTVTWSPNPATFVPVNSSTASGLVPGVQGVTVTTEHGCKVTTTLNVLSAPPPVSFSITGNTLLTCTNPTVSLSTITNYTFGTLSYTWSSLTFTANTPTVIVNQTGTVNVYGVDLATGCNYTQSVVVTSNTVPPTNSVNPVNQVVTCNTLTPATFSGSVISPTINFVNSWYSPVNPPPAPPMTTCNTSLCPAYFTSPGTYSFITCNTFNGCCTTQTVNVSSLSAFPTYSMSSPTNFSIGCVPLHQTTLSIINPVATGTPPGICTYAFMAPSYTGAPVFAPAPSSTITQIPGTWTVIVMDQSNGCQTTVHIPVLQNTIAPHVLASAITQMLSCKNPTILATGTSTTPNTTVSWIVPSMPPNLSTPTVVIGDLANGPNISTTSLTYANFTVVAHNALNACETTSIVTITQNFKPPVSSPAISIATPTAIYCNSNSAPVVLTTGNSTTTSGGGPLAFPVPVLWQGPSPQTTVTGASSYSCYVAGIYSLTIMDNYNGCLKTGTINVLDKTQPPVLTSPLDSAILDCGSDKATLLPAINGTTGGLKYYFYHYPQGTAFSPTNAITPFSANADLSGTSSATIQVDKAGEYEYCVTNTVTGCRAYGSFIVVDGALNADFVPDPYVGYAPLLVTFTNASASSSGSGSITSVWNFGNGTSQVTSNNNPSTTFMAPGNYTVILYASKGVCLDTISKVIKVEMPSKLEVPNVFTPNGDGSNDIFFLKTANITEVHSLIFDRWGNKVYETTSGTGNIAWDGKNLSGKECATGVYFYTVKGKGKDDKDYESKGNVSLFR